MYRAFARGSNIRHACAAVALLGACLPAPANLDAEAASRLSGPEAPSVRPSPVTGPSTNGLAYDAAVEPDPARVAGFAASRPHVIDGAVADAIVLLRGGVCSGTPISGTVYVVTAAHCVLTESGDVTRRTIMRGGNAYTAVEVLVDANYHDHPTSQLDAAVLVMDQVIPGPATRVGAALPDIGEVWLAGFQPVDGSGELLRGHRHDDHPLLSASTGVPVEVSYRPAGCVDSAASLDVSPARVMVSCGLVPGASGGGLFSERDGELVLVGIVSTVTADLTANGVVPLAALHELLEHPDRYMHGFSPQHVHHEQVLHEHP
jgi:Trypsin-like peptidase domain